MLLPDPTAKSRTRLSHQPKCIQEPPADTAGREAAQTHPTLKFVSGSFELGSVLVTAGNIVGSCYDFWKKVRQYL